MLTPFQLNHLSQPVVKIYSEIENDILDTISKELATDKTIDKGSIMAWQFDKLQQMGDLNKQVIEIIAKRAGITFKALVEMIHQAGIISIEKMDGWLSDRASSGSEPYQPPPLKFDTSIHNLLLNYQRQAKDATNLINSNVLKSAAQVYRNIISKTTAEVMSGFTDFDSAIAQTSSEWAEKGVPALTDSAGRNWSIEGYVPMVMRSTANSVACESQMSRLNEYGHDLVDVSSHAGARPLCEPFQGKTYSLSGASKDFPPLADTSYGQIAGLFGINCGHFMYPHVDGEENPYPTYPKAQNDALYAKVQQQRYYERQVRKAKTRQSMMKNLGNEKAIKRANDLVRKRQKTIREYVKANNLARRYEREQIVTPK